MDEIIKRQRAIVDEHIRHENAHNWAGVYDTFVKHEHAYCDVVPFNTRFAGYTGVQDFYASAQIAFPDFKIQVLAEYDAPGCSVREVFIAGKHEGDWAGIAATGKFVRFPLAGFFLFEDGKLLAERIYFDNETIVRQMKGELDADAIIDFSQPIK